MKVLTSVDIHEVFEEIIEHYEDVDLEAFYNFLDSACVAVENELIERGYWEEDE